MNMNETKKIRICFFTYSLFTVGGLQRVLAIVTDFLCKFYEVYIFCYDKPYTQNKNLYKFNENIYFISYRRQPTEHLFRRFLRKTNQKFGYLETLRIESLYKYVYLLPKEFSEYLRIIRDYKIDIAIGVGALESYYLSYASDKLECKTIGWQHSSFEAYFKTKGTHFWGMGDYIFRCLNRLDCYIVLNEYDKNLAEKYLQTYVNVIPNPKSFVSKDKASLQNKKFISVGRFIDVKGFDLLVKAFEIVARKYPEWTLEIYGDGELFEFIKDIVKNRGLEKKIILPGTTSNVLSCLLNASCYVLSSRYEGMPMVVLEAMEAGLPIISFDITAMIPLVSEGVEGILVPKYSVDDLATAMERICSDYELRKKMGYAASNKAKKFSVEIVQSLWISLINRLQKID